MADPHKGGILDIFSMMIRRTEFPAEVSVKQLSDWLKKQVDAEYAFGILYDWVHSEREITWFDEPCDENARPMVEVMAYAPPTAAGSTTRGQEPTEVEQEAASAAWGKNVYLGSQEGQAANVAEGPDETMSSSASSTTQEPVDPFATLLHRFMSINPRQVPIVPVDDEVRQAISELAIRGNVPDPEVTSGYVWTMMLMLAGMVDKEGIERFITMARKVTAELQCGRGFLVSRSKELAYLLRHEARLPREEGWSTMDELLSWLRYPHELTSWKMLSVILFNDKQRYTLRLGLRRRLGKDVPTLFIQAKQGHGQTIPVEPSQLLQEELSYWNTARLKPVVHGTVINNWSGIKAEGLIPGYGGTNRSANHFMATGMLFRGKHTNLSKVNPWSTLFIELDLDEWLKKGNKAYLSKNGVVNIYDKAPKEYFKLVVKGSHNMPLRSTSSLISWWDVLWPVMCHDHVPSFNQIAKAYGNVPSPPAAAPSSSSKVEEMPTTPALKKLQEEATKVLKMQKEEKKKQKDKGKKEQAPGC